MKPDGQVLQRSCPKCNGYLGILVAERKAKMPVQAINGRCLKCGYRLAWALARGKTSEQLTLRRSKAR
jgi:C4-type Zn-finger protein